MTLNRIATVLLIGLLLAACVPNRAFNDRPDLYRQTYAVEGHPSAETDLVIVEFDEFGSLWDRAQLEAALALIEKRNAASTNGVAVVTYTHGWQNNANYEREGGDLDRFRASMGTLAADLLAEGYPAPDHVVAVYLAWRGSTTRAPLARELTFWDRRDTAERIASYDLREAIFRITEAAKTRPDTKVLVSGHSMGGMIIAQALGPSLSTMLLTQGARGVPMMADLVILQNPALDALASYQLIDYLRRTRTVAELRHTDGRVEPAPGPIIASITSEADWVTGLAYPLGRIIGRATAATRDDHPFGQPSQWHLATRAQGHVDWLVSHRAYVEDDQVVVEPIEGAWNTTPFWVIRTSREICKDHGDIHNPRFVELLERVTQLNRFYDSSVTTWVRTGVGGGPAFEQGQGVAY